MGLLSNRKRRKKISNPTTMPVDPTSFKNPFQSKTIWGAIITTAAIIAPRLGLDVDASELKGIVAYCADNWDLWMSAVGTLLTVWGRITASKPISLKRASDG